MANNADSVFEFRGVKDLYFAEVTEDSEENYKEIDENTPIPEPTESEV